VTIGWTLPALTPRDDLASTIFKPLEQLERANATMRAEPVKKRNFRMRIECWGKNALM
jgi:hypothetical protein